MVVGTAERHIQVFNLTNPVAAFKVRPSVECQLAHVLMDNQDYCITVEMANKSHLMLPNGERVCYWKCGGTSGYPV